MALVVTYLYRAAGGRFAIWAGIAQLVFLVLFSYAFFFEGYTGLVITIGAILTLAIMMQLTAKVDWTEVFRKKEPKSQAADRAALTRKIYSKPPHGGVWISVHRDERL